MPYIDLQAREFILVDKDLYRFTEWLTTVPIEQRKGFLAYIIEYLTKYSFDLNYFGRSTGLDALRSAFIELKQDLLVYEKKKREEHGDI